MKILLVHNYYGSSVPSGENAVFEAEARLLEAAGHELRRHTRSNDEIAGSRAATAMHGLLLPWNAFAAAALRREIAAFRPDVVHFHNTFPLLSPAVIHAAHDCGCAVVATLHNHRIACANGGMVREGKLCTLCLDRGHPWMSVRYGCWNSGRLATLPVALMIAVQQRLGTWSEAVDALIVLTDFQKTLVERAGAPAQRIHVKPNFTAAVETLPWSAREDKVVCLGRVSPEKGIQPLLAAWQQLGDAAPLLEIVGGGIFLEPARTEAQRLGLDRRVKFLGQLSHEQAMERLAGARLLVFPSVWYEPFGLSIIEAYARGVPVAASNLGSLPDLVQDGVTGALFAADDPAALAACVAELWGRPEALERSAEQAHAAWTRRFTPQASLAQFEAIYVAAIERRQHRRRTS